MFGKNNQNQEEPDFEFFAIYDSKVQNYRSPMYSPSKIEMCRELELHFSDPQHALSQYNLNAEDFALFKIGHYHKKTGMIHAQNPEHVANLHELRSHVQNKLKAQIPERALPST